MQPIADARALAREDSPGVIGEFARATELAYEAGFDGVEAHCASGYLPAQFLSTGSNQRTDEYGGSLENRLRFVLEVLEAMAAADGADRVGFRICPGNPFNDLSDENPEETFVALLERVRDMGLAYCHVIRLNSIPNAPDLDNVAIAAKAFGSPLIVNDSYKIDEARSVVDSGVAAAVAASFNAPIAGVFFALAVVIGHYALKAFAPIVIASVTGTTVRRLYFGDFPAFLIREYPVVSFL